jgi:hypothetical protein
VLPEDSSTGLAARRLAVHSDWISTTPRMPVASCLKLLQHGFDCSHDSRCLKERKTVRTTEGDEVERLRFLKPVEAVRHGAMVVEPGA